jgi:predicted amidohydrolase
MKICLAQINPVKGDIAANLDIHKNYTRIATNKGTNCIFFPELSLTSYEPSLAEALVLKEGDNTLKELQALCNQLSITIAAGMPTAGIRKPRISMLIFQPGKPLQVYSKQLLHPDELPFFEAGEKQVVLAVNNNLIAPAICYESLQPDHSAQACQLGATIYLASVAKSQQGIERAMAHFPQIARSLKMQVLMVNSIGICDNFQAVGKSTVWANDGKILGQLTSDEEGILIYDTETNQVV